LRYVGNMKKSSADNFSNQTDKAVFPPGSIIPENMQDDAVMYRQNPTMGQQQGFQTNQRQMQQNVRDAGANENAVAHTRDNMSDNNPNLHGLMDYEGMEFPFSSGGVLRRSDSPDSGFVGSVEDPRGFSPANGLGGRPVMNEGNMSGNMNQRPMRPMGGAHGPMICGPSVRLSDIMCMYAGKNIEIEFLFGADTYVKKSGILSGAGMNFIILTDPQSGQRTICDLTDMKFVSIESQ